ncbi:MAG: HD domain-containing protein [Nitrospirae bacterium]|nr:HD domain-containing protein [Nitrospirota bacterium]MCL5976669.1 HD domain-containing protein [Nitrospirota bacterium]
MVTKYRIINDRDSGILKEPDKAKEQKDSFLEDPLAFKEYSFHKEEHYLIDKTVLTPEKEIFFNIYRMDRFNIFPVIEASKKQPSKIDSQLLNFAGDFVIKKSDIPLYHDYLLSLTELSDPSEEGKIKTIMIRENSKLIMKDLLDDPRSGKKIKESKIMVNNMVDCILQNRDAIYSMLSLKNYDYYTYTHSVNVAVLSVGLGVAIDLKRNDVEKLGTGALLHDIGKSAISHEILNKQGKLDSKEYLIMRNHVTEGEKILRTHKEVSEESFDAVLQHHEKLTGKGYPMKLQDGEIKLFGRITAIADCYDALTTRRPYKPAFTPFNALSIVAKETGNYDPELLGVFIKMLGKIK